MLVRHRSRQFCESSFSSRNQRTSFLTAVKLTVKWLHRIIDLNLKYLTSQLENGDNLCGEVLRYVNLEDETHHGLSHQMLVFLL